MRKCLLSILWLMVSLLAFANEPIPTWRPRPWTSLQLGLGRSNQLDTYLSPLEYTGQQLSLLYEGFHPLKRSQYKVSFTSLLQMNGAATSAWEGSIDCWEGDVHYDALWQYTFLPKFAKNHLSLRLGGGVGGTLGGAYYTHQGNNPANAHLQLRLMASAEAEYEFMLFRRWWVARYHVDAPLLGAMFSPAYGQSYYEIFERGNYDHNVVFTHPGNCASVRQMLNLDIPVGKNPQVLLRVGYLSDIRQAKPNNLEQHQISRSFTIGFVKYLRK